MVDGSDGRGPVRSSDARADGGLVNNSDGDGGDLVGDSDNDGGSSVGILFRCASNGNPLLSTSVFLGESVSAAFRWVIGPRGEADVDVDL